MKCRQRECSTPNKVDKVSAAAESKMHPLKESPEKDPNQFKPQHQQTDTITELSSHESIRSPLRDKENITCGDVHDTTPDCVHEDSGYLSLQNSEVNVYATEESGHLSGSASSSPSKSPGFAGSLTAAFTPIHRSKRRLTAFSLSSTPSNQHGDPGLPILKFQKAVCEELAKSYQKNKKYDWSLVSKVAEDHLLDRVIGRQMGLEYVDIFTSLLTRNMKTILTNILAQLSDMDLIRCRAVSRTWRKIICEDAAAVGRCQRAEQSLRESRNSLKKRNMTGDASVSRVVLSCMQSLPSPAPPQRSHTSNSQTTHFNKYVQAAKSLKTHESLRSCRRCGSPTVLSSGAQRATCTRPSCLFDFCTCCQEAFHGSTPCRVVKPRGHFASDFGLSPNVSASARSKRSIRRL